jgi:hypothetical protein
MALESSVVSKAFRQVSSALSRSLLMNISSARPVAIAAGRWSLTRSDLLLCALPIALFLSIVSFV